MFDKVKAFLSGRELSRVTALVIVLFVGVQGFLSVRGTEVGLDANSAQYALGVVGSVVIVARELVVPVILPFLGSIFGSDDA